MISRRDFLKTMTAATAGASLARAAEAKPLVIGSQLYGWGQYYDRDKKAYDLDEILSALRDAGYDYAEGSSGISPATLKFADALRAKGLKPLSTYSGGRFHDDKGEEVVAKIAAGAKEFRQAGFSILVCNPDAIGRMKTDAELATQVKNLKLLASELNKAGVKLAIHHHTPEMAGNAKEFHYNFKNSKPDEVGFCYDVHWVFRGGVQPADALRDYSDRIHTWHLRQSRAGVWWEDLDTGDVDYPGIGQHAKTQGVPRNYTVELAIENGTKITRTVVENHRRSLAYIRQAMA